ncbi:MAG: nicotinamide mononucleotide transporter [Limosilactobacillus gorillae]|uniref:nicotinamide mononucleotide transporter n=1 Tax=Limosilactobacillus gorillae TaxID=1450649 RepID=UPI000ABC835A|nr:nicotinamide mononucleotide transporter [Limosilactobacillus gorillae]MDO4855907.1 nicotinamide mononucleotide transporter [Limosilactobacillus gorillae]
MLQKIAKSKSFDLLGVLIVVTISIASGYLTETLADVTHWGPWTAFVPFGIISIGNSILSIYSTRLTGRMNNLGNIVGIANVVLSGSIDYILGNKAAVITYPVTFIIYTVAIEHWKKTNKYQSSKPMTGIKGILTIVGMFTLSMIFSLGTNFIGWTNGLTNPLFWITVIAFGLSLGANVLNAMKFEMQWKFWMLYNFIQLVKAGIQGNFANLGKYVYYIINAIAALAFWKNPIKVAPTSKINQRVNHA